jgi:Fe-S cluster assembly protein SufD
MTTTENTSGNTGLGASHLARFGALKSTLPGDGLDWLSARREEALRRFESLGVPAPRLEDWKFTNLRALEKADPTPVPDTAPALDSAPAFLPNVTETHRIVFVNGRFAPGLSGLDGLPNGVEALPLAATLDSNPALLERQLGAVADTEDQAFLALNDAYFADGLLLQVAAHSSVEAPIELIYVNVAEDAAISVHPRCLLVLEEGSSATVVERVTGIGETPVLANHVTEISIGANASLRRYKVQDAPSTLFHIATEHLRLDRDARLDSFTLTTGNRLTRNDTRIRLSGEGAECRFNGVYLQRGSQHCDNTSVVTHLVPNARCRQIYKGALDGAARGVFQGRIVVEPDAQKSDGRMMNKTLLLSEKAEIDTKPELEIFADDVQCAHGATAGELDQDSLFYLRTRGIPEAAAQRMLVQAFLNEVVGEIEDETLHAPFLGAISGWLGEST